MQTKSFGHSTLRVPTIGQGTWKMGDAALDLPAEVAALRLGLDLGLTHIDTAEMYGRGGAEEVVAAAIRGRRREDLFLASKVLPTNASRKGTVTACEASLRRLKVDHLDLYMLHWAGSHPIGETMRGMEDLVGAGKIRLFGVSNFDVGELEEAIAAVGPGRIVSNQVLYNLANRGIEWDLIPFCRRHGVAVVGYTPFGGMPSPRSRGGKVLASVGARHLRTPSQVILRFLTRDPIAFTIPKAVTPEHVRENAGGADFELGPQDLAELDAAFPPPTRKLPLAMA